MKLQLNEQGYVIGYAIVGEIENSIPYDNDIPDDFGQFYHHYRLIDNILQKDEGYISEIEKETLRNRRNTECFSIINRGLLWYETLSLIQKAELLKWYNAWLNVTRTNEIPLKPSWLE